MPRMTPAPTLWSPAIEKITRGIVDVAKPAKIILFGSHARGEPHPGSDVDLMVIVPEPANRRRLWDKISNKMRRLGAFTDVVVTTPSAIARYGDLVGMVYRPALREGRLIYEAESGNGIPGQSSPSWAWRCVR
jgi:predicted nucleotidyltransferase